MMEWGILRELGRCSGALVMGGGCGTGYPSGRFGGGVERVVNRGTRWY